LTSEADTVVSLALQPLYPQEKESPVPAEQEAGFGPRAVRDTLENKKPFFLLLATIAP